MTPKDATFLYQKLLRAMERWIDKAEQNAKDRGFAPEKLIGCRLSPDQFSLGQQIQAACDSAKLGTAKLAGVEPPSHPDTEKTFAELRERIHTCLAYVATFEGNDFAGWEERPCTHAWMAGNWLRGSDYVQEFAVPNFLFHATTAYSILRHCGVPLGKGDFIAPLTMQR